LTLVGAPATDSPAVDDQGGDEPAGDIPSIVRRGGENRPGQRRRGRDGTRDDLDDRDDTGRFRYGLASIGLAPEEDEPVKKAVRTGDGGKGPDGPGDRVDGWVRPEYHDRPEFAGAYWTPVPGAVRDDDEPYGWPIPINRLPAVPDYEPATGFDLVDASEPTAQVPQWPPLRPADQIDHSRAWTRPDDDRGAVPTRRARSESTQLLPTLDEEAEDQRPRPRPRPSTVYRSKHAAE
jgi:hypothetical protein